MNQTIKRVLLAGSATALTVASLAACTPNSTSGSGSWFASGSAGSAAAAGSSAVTATSTTGVVPAYNYLGYSAVPNCDDLATIASGHYYTEYTYYSQTINEDGTSYLTRNVKYAQDGINYAMHESQGEGEDETQIGSIDGAYMAADIDAQQYFVEDHISTYEDDAKAYADAIAANDDSNSGVTFVEEGSETLPLQSDDTAKYTYYEFECTDPNGDELEEESAQAVDTEADAEQDDEELDSEAANVEDDAEDDEFADDSWDEFDDEYSEGYDADYGFPVYDDYADAEDDYTWTERIYVDADGKLVAHYYDYGDFSILQKYTLITKDIPEDFLQLPNVIDMEQIEW